jgi:hypothetical protein
MPRLQGSFSTLASALVAPACNLQHTALMKWTARSNDGETALAAARRAVRGTNNVLRTRYPISLDEFSSTATRKGTRGDKRVLLTFDDARRSFYEVALPGSPTAYSDLSHRTTIVRPTSFSGEPRADRGLHPFLEPFRLARPAPGRPGHA